MQPDFRVSIDFAMERMLRHGILDAWYPRAIDRDYGGFLTDLTYEWLPYGQQHKMIVTQARHLFAASRATELYADVDIYAEAAAAGAAFLRDVLFDHEYGGFHALVTREGTPIDGGNDPWLAKTAYGHAFAIFALASWYRASGDEQALQLACDTFGWLESCGAHDAEFGGYWQWLRPDGTPHKSWYMDMPPKDQNSTIHLLESFTELYAVWPNELLGNRLAELLELVRDTIATPTGYLQLFFEGDWTPVTIRYATDELRAANYDLDHISFGHDVETAFLMLDAARVLSLDDGVRTPIVARRLVDHALRWGWDNTEGGFVDRAYRLAGTTQPTIIAATKVWWAQAEGLNTLLLMSDRFDEKEGHYLHAFEKLWDYVQNNLFDDVYGGWYWGGLDKEPERRWGPKAETWKGPYHTVRSLFECIRRIRSSEPEAKL